MNFRFPIFLDLSGKKCLVTGAGFEIAGKVQALVDAAAIVIYVHPSAEPRIEQLAAEQSIEWRQRDWQPGDLDGCFLVISDLEDNSEVFALAEARNILCNSVDDPAYCRFSFGSIHRQGELTIAISTNGRAPAVAVRLRQWLERNIGPEYAALLEFMRSARPEVNAGIAEFDARRDLWYRIVDSDVLQMLQNGQEAEAEAQMRGMIDEAINSTSRSQIVSDSEPR